MRLSHHSWFLAAAMRAAGADEQVSSSIVRHGGHRHLHRADRTPKQGVERTEHNVSNNPFEDADLWSRALGSSYPPGKGKGKGESKGKSKGKGKRSGSKGSKSKSSSSKSKSGGRRISRTSSKSNSKSNSKSKSATVLPSSLCRSPFGANERHRLVECYGRSSIFVGAFDANVAFAAAVTAAVSADGSGLGSSPSSEFNFFVQMSGRDVTMCPAVSSPELCGMLECLGTTQEALGDFVGALLADPKTLPTSELYEMCGLCAEISMGQDYEGQGGGGGSGAGFQLFCTDVSGKHSGMSTPLLTSGGGGGGGAGGQTVGSGGGAGMQVLLENDLFDRSTACSGGGCGLGTPDDDFTAQDGTITADAGCDKKIFSRAMKLVKKKIEACNHDPKTAVSIAAGGGAGGGIDDVFSFSTGFSYNVGPKQVLGSDDGGEDGGSSDTIVPCRMAFANIVCENAGYLDEPSTAFELCTCPLQQLYAPQPYDYECVNENSPAIEGKPLTEELLEANCQLWCPGEGEVKTDGGEVCTRSLPPACLACSS